MQAIDLLCEWDAAGGGGTSSGDVARPILSVGSIDALVPSLASSRSTGDLRDWPLRTTELLSSLTSDLSGVASVWPCHTWVPGLASAEVLDALVCLDDDWPASFRVVMGDDDPLGQLEAWLAGDLPAVLADLRRPLIVDLRECRRPDFGAVYQLACSNPALPLILAPPIATPNRVLSSLGLACPNVLYVVGYGRAAEANSLAAEFGPNRLVFGTGYPCGSSADALAIAEDLPVSRSDRETIVRGNAELLLRGGWSY